MTKTIIWRRPSRSGKEALSNRASSDPEWRWKVCAVSLAPAERDIKQSCCRKDSELLAQQLRLYSFALSFIAEHTHTLTLLSGHDFTKPLLLSPTCALNMFAYHSRCFEKKFSPAFRGAPTSYNCKIKKSSMWFWMFKREFQYFYSSYIAFFVWFNVYYSNQHHIVLLYVYKRICLVNRFPISSFLIWCIFSEA